MIKLFSIAFGCAPGADDDEGPVFTDNEKSEAKSDDSKDAVKLLLEERVLTPESFIIQSLNKLEKQKRAKEEQERSEEPKEPAEPAELSEKEELAPGLLDEPEWDGD